MDNKNLKTILDFLGSLFASNKGKILEKTQEIAVKEVAKPVAQVQVEIEPEPTPVGTNWSDPSSKISKYFTVKEAVMLREWNRLGNESDGLNEAVKNNLTEMFKKLDTVREFIGVPIFIKSAWRPSAYNVAIGGAKQSAHMASANYAAIDWWTDINGDGAKNGKDCDELKALLMPKLEEWGLRMEDNGKGATWIHLDNKPVPAGGNRFFKP